jgi:hypothetical protein
MERYFFDVVAQGRSVYDYVGREFATLEGAQQLAELIALDLALDGDWLGWAVAIRDPHGQNYLCVPVKESELLAA